MIKLLEEKSTKGSFTIKIIVTNEIYITGEEFTITLTKRGGNVFQTFSEIPQVDSDDAECLAYLIGKGTRELLGIPLVFH